MIGREKSRHCQTCLERRSLLNENLQRIESRIELQNLQILKKMLEKSSQFLSSEQPCEPKSWEVALKITGVEKIPSENLWFHGQPRGHLIRVLNESCVNDGGDFCLLWLVILKSA